MTETQTFHIGDILTITTGRLVSPSHIDGVYKICDWMTGESNFTHQLPRVSREIEPQLREDFPDLAAIVVPDWEDATKETVYGWLDEQVKIYGETREVRRLADPSAHESIDPLSEIARMRPDLPIIPVVASDG
jgi:hypothetical protein